MAKRRRRTPAPRSVTDAVAEALNVAAEPTTILWERLTATSAQTTCRNCGLRTRRRIGSAAPMVPPKEVTYSVCPFVRQVGCGVRSAIAAAR